MIDLPQASSVVAHCDPVHAENILANLVSNAVKYSPARTPVCVVVTVKDAQAECVVTNHGTLDDPAERESLFERYFRGRNADGHPGIGVGLYLARTLARLQGGDVELQHAAAGTVKLALMLPRHQPLSITSRRKEPA